MINTLIIEWYEKFQDFKRAFWNMVETVFYSNVFLLVLVGTLFYCIFLYLQGPPPPSLPPIIQPYSLPEFTGAPPRVSLPFSARKTTPAQERLAMSFLTRGGAAMEHGDFSGAVQAFRQAIALDPKNTLLQKALRNAMRREAWKREQGRINEAVRRGSASQAWQIFDAATGKDPAFFFYSTPLLARRLLRSGQTASAVAILLRYCRSRPKDHDMAAMLQEHYYWARQPGFSYGP